MLDAQAAQDAARRTDLRVRTVDRRCTAAGHTADQTAAKLAQLTQRVDKVEAVTLAAGQAAVPSLLLGATANVTVTLTPAMPDATYSAVATLSGGVGLLSNAVIVGVTAKTATTVTVTVRATGVLATGATLAVIAARHN